MKIILQADRPDYTRERNMKLAMELVDPFEDALFKLDDRDNVERIGEYAIQLIAERLFEITHSHGGEIDPTSIEIKQ